MKWEKIKSRKDIPGPGSYLVTRKWDKDELTYKPAADRDYLKEELVVCIAAVIKYKNKRYWVCEDTKERGPDAYPYENVVAWQELPKPFGD